MKFIAVLTLSFCFIVCGVQSSKVWELKKCTYKHQSRNMEECKRCFDDSVGEDYTKTNESFLGSVAFKYCDCKVVFPDTISNSTLTCEKKGRIKWTGARCNCPEDDDCPATLDDEEYSKTLGNSFRSVATKPCIHQISCDFGYTGLIKHKCRANAGEINWTNTNAVCRCNVVTCRNLGDRFIYSNGLKHGSVAAAGNDKYCLCQADGKWSFNDCSDWEMKDERDCWKLCNEKAGPCYGCGNDDRPGHCCKKGWIGDRQCTDDQQAVADNGNDNHVCVWKRLV